MIGKSIFQKEFASNFGAMREVIDQALGALEKRGWLDKEQHFQAHLCLEEAIVNAIQHGNHGDPDLKVGLELIDEGDVCRIVIRDQGPGFSPEKVEKPPAEELGGRGVYLMKCFMDRVCYNEATQSLEMILPKRKNEMRK